jgi:hypothetical protein
LTSTSVFADMMQGLFQPVLPGNECRPVTGAQTTLTPNPLPNIQNANQFRVAQ